MFLLLSDGAKKRSQSKKMEWNFLKPHTKLRTPYVPRQVVYAVETAQKGDLRE